MIVNTYKVNKNQYEQQKIKKVRSSHQDGMGEQCAAVALCHEVERGE